MSVFAAINKKVTFVVNLGPSNTGLVTVGYTLINGDGTSFQARTTAGVTEIANGFYYVEVGSAVFTAAFDGFVKWDIATVVKTAEDVYISDRIDAAISTRSTYAGGDTSGTTTLLSRLTSGRGTNLDNLDATVSSRSTYAGGDTSGTTTLLARLTATRAANLDFLDAAISGVAAAAWNVLTSAISTTGSIGKLLKDNIDAAVSSRSTYAGGDTAGTTTLLSRLSATRAGYLDNLTNLDATISGIATAVWAAGTRTLTSASYTLQNIIDGVWNALLSGYTTAGSAGKTLSSAGAAGDPWATALPGAYTSGQAGAILSAVKAKTDLITTTSITLTAPVLVSGGVALVQGDDYKAADGRALQWSSTGWPSPVGGSVSFQMKSLDGASTFSKAGSVLSASSVQVELTAANTAALGVGGWTYAVKATLSDGDVVTLATGAVAVSARP